MSARAQRFYRRSFLPQYKKLQAQISATTLGILVWGPSSSGGDLYGKRLQIRDVLRNKGDAALFSEEIDEEMGNFGLPANARELLQAMTADFIIVIYGSPGAIAEVHDFAHFLQEIGSKLVVFVDERYVTGYGYSGALQELNEMYNNVATYKYPEDIRDCHFSARFKSVWVFFELQSGKRS